MAQRYDLSRVNEESVLEEMVVRFAREREWEQFHDPKNLAMALCAETGELAAVLRWIPNNLSDQQVEDGVLREHMLDEMGDIGILLLLLCKRLGVQLQDVVHAKMQKNEVRYPVEASRGRAERPSG